VSTEILYQSELLGFVFGANFGALGQDAPI